MATMLCLFSLFAFAADQRSQVYTEADKNIVVSEKQPAFTLKLKSNPTTGYVWSLSSYPADAVELVKHYFERSTSKLIGAPGYDYWLFKLKPLAFQNGHDIRIEMTYSRPWESKETASSEVFIIKVGK